MQIMLVNNSSLTELQMKELQRLLISGDKVIEGIDDESLYCGLYPNQMMRVNEPMILNKKENLKSIANKDCYPLKNKNPNDIFRKGRK